MRIIAGRLGGRQFKAPRGRSARPTQDRVREALFSALARRIGGSVFLDLYAGSGSVGMEAWSRGAAAVWCGESHPATARLLEHNARALGIDEGLRVVRTETERFLRRNADGRAFDVVFADPPYGLLSEAAAGAGTRGGAILNRLKREAWLTEDAVVIFELEISEAFEAPSPWQRVKQRRYGKSRLDFLQLKERNGQ